MGLVIKLGQDWLGVLTWEKSKIWNGFSNDANSMSVSSNRIDLSEVPDNKRPS